MSGERVPGRTAGRLQGLAAALVIVVLWASAADADEAWRWSGVQRIVAVSDVHGAAGPMLEVLVNAGVIDEHHAWRAGDTHLVVTGDLLDRGPDSRRAMDILMRLEREAAAAGGRVHVLLGNHEAMNLVGDLRYVSTDEYLAFAEDEAPAERESAYAVFRQARGDDPGPDEAFERLAPPGFFAHRKAFAPAGRYGKWLLEKPLLVIINDIAFVHGGLSPLVAELGLDGVNGRLKEELVRYVDHLATLQAAGVLAATDNFHDHPEILRQLPDGPARPGGIDAAIDEVPDLAGGAVHDPASPLWYRGNVACSPLIEIDRIGQALERLGAARVVIGHTPTPGRVPRQRLGGRVLEIDTGMLNAYYGGQAHALVIDNGTLSVVSQGGGGTATLLPHPQQAAMQAGRESVEQVEQALATGRLVSSTRDDAGTAVELQDGAGRLQARFRPLPRKGYAPEVAAYRLDKLLGLEMVPAAVLRTIDGREGSLQLMPPAVADEASRAAQGGGAAAWCPLPEQWQAMYLFDALIGNDGRKPHNMRYARGSWNLVLTEHGSAFQARGSRPRYLEQVELQPGAAWAEALAALTDERLQASLGDVLDARRLRALGKRRDALLQAAAAGARAVSGR